MIRITEPHKCTGCQACKLLCPVNAIEITEDKEGFLVPQINEALCINCRLCESRCPENNRPKYIQKEFIKILGARYKDDAIISKSASGGAFAGIANKILETSGNSVFGCTFDKELVARHICINDINDIALLQSSKYVQSDVGDTYAHTYKLLSEGVTVLYTGTPCQIAGLYAYLGKDYEKLLTIDLVCHGVPSPLLFKRYKNYLENKYKETIVKYNFRSKDRSGWGTGRAEAETKNKRHSIIASLDPYYNSFLNGYTYRECCYSCQYANSRRVADMTIGDYWGIENYHPDFNDARGVSLILINSGKGEHCVKSVYNSFEVVETTLEKASARNGNLQEPSYKPELRDSAYQDIQDMTINIFKNLTYKIDNKVYIKTYTKECIKRILPPFALKLYKTIKRK